MFPETPLTGFGKQNNIRSRVIKSKVPVKQKVYERKLRGMKKCGKACTACPHIIPGKSVKIYDKTQWKINKKRSCDT